MSDKARASALKLGGRYNPSVIPFRKAHDLYINADFRKNGKFDIFINKIFRFVKKISLKVPYFATRVPKLCGRYSQV